MSRQHKIESKAEPPQVYKPSSVRVGRTGGSSPTRNATNAALYRCHTITSIAQSTTTFSKQTCAMGWQIYQHSLYPISLNIITMPQPPAPLPHLGSDPLSGLVEIFDVLAEIHHGGNTQGFTTASLTSAVTQWHRKLDSDLRLFLKAPWRVHAARLPGDSKLQPPNCCIFNYHISSIYLILVQLVSNL